MQKNLFLLNLGLRDDRFNQLYVPRTIPHRSVQQFARGSSSHIGIAWWAFDEVHPGWRRRGKQSGGSYTHFMLTEEQPHQCCGRTSRAITNQKGRRLFADDDRLFTATAAATTTFRSSRLCVMHFAAIVQSCIFAQSVVKIQLIMRLDGWLPGYLSTAPVFARSPLAFLFVCCCCWCWWWWWSLFWEENAIAICMSSSLLWSSRGARQCLTYHEINFELNFTSLVCLFVASQPASRGRRVQHLYGHHALPRI